MDTKVPSKNITKETALTKLPIVILLAAICCFLWGSAFPCIKIGYQLFHIASTDTASQLLFAGLRFTLAGILVILVGSLSSHRFLFPAKASLLNVCKLSLFQTILQYFFFYVGLANASGVKSSIIEASSTFLSILIASLIFRYEKLTASKLAGCILGFGGVILVNVAGNGMDFQMSFTGEGFILISALSYAFSSVLVKKYSASESPITLSGYQFVLGGLILSLVGLAGGGRIHGFTPVSLLLLLYMAMISAVAYSLWGLLLKYNPVSRVAIFGFLNPLCGVILSALLLNEKNQAFSLAGLISLVLVCLGIFIVNKGQKASTPNATVDLILFMGQSNMAGRGITSDEHPEPAPSLLPGAGWEYRSITAPDVLSPLEEPFGCKENTENGINDGNMKTGSMVTAFVNACYTQTQVPIVALSASKGGSSILKWQPGTPFMEDVTSRLKTTRSFLADKQFSIRHTCLVWCQGETDGDHHMPPEQYLTYFQNFWNALKEQGVEHCFLIPIGRYNGEDPSISYDELRACQMSFPDTFSDVSIASTAFQTMKDRGLMKDSFHYYQQAYNEVGTEAGTHAGTFFNNCV